LKSWGDQSDRAIADHIKVSDKTVAKIRVEKTGKNTQNVVIKQERTAEIRSCDENEEKPHIESADENPQKRTGKDGKKRTLPDVKKSTPPPSGFVPAPILDKVGQAIPAHLLPLWYRASEVRDVIGALSGIKCKMEKSIEENDLLWAEVSFNPALAALQTAYNMLKVAIPFAVCPSCQGVLRDTCTLCVKRGILSEHRFNMCVPQEMKDRIARKAAK
jgi:hypothetical protein